MEVIYGLIPGMIILGLVAVAVLFWAARSGQFDDLEGDAQRILMDDDDMPVAKTADNQVEEDSAETDQSSDTEAEKRQ